MCGAPSSARGSAPTMVAAAYERSAELHLYNLSQGTDPELQPLRRLRPRFLHWCKLSPDAEWLACATIGTPEDVVLLRADGSELRRLTDDAFKDRNISWSRDGSRLVFDSTRSGGWDVWTVRADGSELRRIADTPDTAAAIWSSDGQRLTFVIPESGLAEVDAARFTAREAIRFVPLPDSIHGFEPGEWSPSGDLLGGTEVDLSRRAVSTGAIVPKTGSYRRGQLPMAGATWLDAYWKFAGWLPDSRHYVAAGREQIAVVDIETGAWRGLQAVDNRRLYVSLSRDGRTLLVEQESVDGDLWMLEIPGGAR
jgi:dipeptidyl aminopeptidase/acylaminoacyl peptidase